MRFPAGVTRMDTTVDGQGVALGEINKYDFRTDSPAVFKARRGKMKIAPGEGAEKGER